MIWKEKKDIIIIFTPTDSYCFDMKKWMTYCDFLNKFGF